MKLKFILLAAVSSNMLLAVTAGLLFAQDPMDQDIASHLTVPPGFHVSVYAQGLGNARGMALSPEGVLYVCDKDGGRVLAVKDKKEEGESGIRVVLEGLRKPHSLAFYQGHIYVGETNRVSRFLLSDQRQTGEDGKTVMDLPEGGNHVTRTILFGPDGKLYLSIGSTCNACVEADERRATICRMDPDGTQFEIFARGLRNAVGLAFRPGTQELWASCNGRDSLGDDLPPECIYRVRKGIHYGWPYSYTLKGKIVPDPDLGKLGIRQKGFPVLEYQAHSAPLGVAFYTGALFPGSYKKGIFVAFHGSWDRSVPVGYKVVFFPLNKNRKGGKPLDFLTGLRLEDHKFGRPVDILTGPQGELFVSDDLGGRIFRITYAENPQK